MKVYIYFFLPSLSLSHSLIQSVNIHTFNLRATPARATTKRKERKKKEKVEQSTEGHGRKWNILFVALGLSTNNLNEPPKKE